MNQTRTHSLLLLTLFAATLAHAAKPRPLPDHWVGTWACAEVARPAPKTGFIPGATGMTIREVIHTSLATSATTPLVRVELTNALGTEPLTIGAVHIALAAPGTTTGEIALASANALTFNGASSITIPAGGEATSDPAALTLPAASDLVVSLFLPAQTISVATTHSDAWATTFVAPGNVVGARSLTAPHTNTSWFFLKSVDVKVPAADAAIVAFGDSITDGYGSTLNANRRWPDVLAARLQADKATSHLAVLNEGIGGNRVLRDNWGPSAEARFDRDVLTLPGVKYVILLEGINDIGNAYSPVNPHDPVTAGDLIAAFTQLAARAHAKGIQVYGATLTPFLGAGYASPAGEQVRVALNAWIRTTPVFDGVIDFDKTTQDPASPNTFNPAYDHGDHLHPSDAGYKAMGDSIDLNLFTPKK